MRKSKTPASKTLMDNPVVAQQLQSLLSDSTIDTGLLVTKIIDMKDNERYLQMHKNDIYQGKDGKWYTYLPTEDGKGRKKIKRTTEYAVKKTVVDYYRQKEEEPCFPEAFKRWIAERMEFNEIADNTYTRYCNTFLRFFKPEDPFCKIKLRDVTVSDMEVFLKRAVVENKVIPKAWTDLKTIMNGTFRYARREGWTEFSISAFFGDFIMPKRIFAVKEEKPDEEDVFTESETTLLVNYLWANPSVENMGLILMFMTGMRVGEATALLKTDVTDESVYVHGTEVNYKDRETNERICKVQDTTKTPAGKRYIFLPEGAPAVLEVLRSLADKGPYLLMKNKKRVTTKMMNYRIQKACKAVGILPRSTHKIRKTYASMLCCGTSDKKLIQAQMGHRDISTTERCYNRERKDVEKRKAIINNVVDLGTDFSTSQGA